MLKYEATPDFDEEHQRLFLLCERLRLALTAESPMGEIKLALQELALRTAEHFRHEEREMRSVQYPQYAWHRQQHQAARRRLHMLARRVNCGDRQASAELLASIAAWLEGHIGIADRMLGAHLRNRRRCHLVATDRASR